MSCTTIIRCALLLGALTTAGLAHAEGRPQEFTWFNLPSDLKSASAPQSARRHVDQLSGVVAEDNLELVQTDTLLGGAALVRFQPRIDGIPVFHEEIALLLDRHHTLVAMRGPLPESLPVSGKALPAFRVDAREAIALALADWHPSMRAMPDLGISMRGGEYERFHADPDGACDNPSDLVLQRARRVWYRTGTGLQPAWYVETQACLAGQSRTGRAHVVSASDRAVLFRKDLNAHATAFEYRVWAEPPPAGLPLPSPRGRAAMPDPDGLPTDNLGAFVPQSSRTLANIPFSRAASDGWLAPGATLTSGNNVSAYTDRVEPDGLSPGDVYPSLTGPLQFNYAFDVNADPASSVTQSSAVVVQMFYILNWLHDWIYDSGFTEADGNAQLDNFGRGGLGGDGIIAEAQDFATDDNARMFTPADGASPRMRVGLATRLVPVGDFALDFRVLAHEWAHHLSSRLIGDASGLGPEHAQGLGEGWSDFVGQLALVKAEDRLKPGNASFEGAYSGPAFHSYYGFRRYPFSTDLSKNPLTLRFVEDGVPLPAGPTPAFGADGADNSQVHRQGEIWAVALWECYASLLNDTQRLSFDEAQARMKAYLVAGMKLTPVAPTMTEARDALLAVVLAGGQMEDYRLFAAAFAKRGFGAGADIPDRYSTSMSGVRESFAQGAHLRLEQFSLSGFAGCDSDSVLDNGETALLAMVAKNTGFERLSGATVRFSANHPGLRFPQGAERTLGPIERNSSQILSLPIELEADLDPNTPITITASPLVLGDNATATQATHVEFVNFDEVPASSMVEDFEGTHLPWEVQRDLSGDGEATWKLRTEATTKFLHGEDTAFSAVIYEPPRLSWRLPSLSYAAKATARIFSSR